MRAFAIAALALLCAATAQAQVKVGVHLYTAHTNDVMHDSTPGIYAVWPVGVAGGNLITGVYRNSLNLPNGQRRVSVYAGQVWQWGRYSITAGAVSGYRKECNATDCWGMSRGSLTPMLAPSVSFPEMRQYLGVTPSLTFIAAKHVAVHFSVAF